MDKLEERYIYSDKVRYEGAKLPLFQLFLRKACFTKNRLLKKIYSIFYYCLQRRYNNEIFYNTKIGYGLYIGHPYCIVINPKAIIGNNVNIHKGVTIGQENRGERKGTPVIGDEVWIGVNATIVGNIVIGNDVLIAPNSSLVAK